MELTNPPFHPFTPISPLFSPPSLIITCTCTCTKQTSCLQAGRHISYSSNASNAVLRQSPVYLILYSIHLLIIMNNSHLPVRCPSCIKRILYRGSPNPVYALSLPDHRKRNKRKASSEARVPKPRKRHAIRPTPCFLFIMKLPYLSSPLKITKKHQCKSSSLVSVKLDSLPVSGMDEALALRI